MSATIGNASQAHQVYTITANCINSKNTARYNHRMQLVITNTGLALYDATARETVWTF